MKGYMFIAVFATLLAVTLAWSKYFDNSYDTWAPARRSFDSGLSGSECIGSGGKCFASGECCKGYVCAAFDDLFGTHPIKRFAPLNPEVPGYCVLEKDLRPCESNIDCVGEGRCIGLGRNKEKYCVARPEEENEVKPKNRFEKPKNTLGKVCTSDNDCEPFSADGKDQLCCQDVRRFRQKTMRICDRVTPLSVCQPSN